MIEIDARKFRECQARVGRLDPRHVNAGRRRRFRHDGCRAATRRFLGKRGAVGANAANGDEHHALGDGARIVRDAFDVGRFATSFGDTGASVWRQHVRSGHECAKRHRSPPPGAAAGARRS